jgi:hypothetical protein
MAVVEHFVVRWNIECYRELLEIITGPAQRRMIEFF